MIRPLKPGDEARLDRFLEQHADSSLFLRSNALTAGLRDEGQVFQATYVAKLDGDDVTGVVAHCWNGNLLLQADVEAGELARRALRATGRPVAGVVGPWSQVVAILASLGLADAETSLRSREDLFAVNLASLHIPAVLASESVSVRRASTDDLASLAQWRKSYRIEALGEVDRPDLLARSRKEVAQYQQTGDLFVLEHADQLVATCAFNARHPTCVQIGAVWTPPRLRSRKYGRAVVAGALAIAKAEGVTRSVLFTGANNIAARTAYEALGYVRVGDYGLVLFRVPQRVEPHGNSRSRKELRR